jgi:hypothetical protein
MHKTLGKGRDLFDDIGENRSAVLLLILSQGSAV